MVSLASRFNTLRHSLTLSHKNISSLTFSLSLFLCPDALTPKEHAHPLLFSVFTITLSHSFYFCLSLSHAHTHTHTHTPSHLSSSVVEHTLSRSFKSLFPAGKKESSFAITEKLIKLKINRWFYHLAIMYRFILLMMFQ